MIEEKRFFELTIIRNPMEAESDIQIDFDTIEEANEFAKRIIFQDQSKYIVLIYEIGNDTGYIYGEYKPK